MSTVCGVKKAWNRAWLSLFCRDNHVKQNDASPTTATGHHESKHKSRNNFENFRHNSKISERGVPCVLECVKTSL